MPELLTLDEARDLVGRSALALAKAAEIPTRSLHPLLHGRPSRARLTKPTADRARRHQAVVASVRHAGLSWIMDDEVEGALAYAAYLHSRSEGAAGGWSRCAN